MNLKKSLNKALETGISIVKPVVEAKLSIIQARSINIIPQDLDISGVSMIEDTQAMTELADKLIESNDYDTSMEAKIAMLHYNLGKASFQETIQKLNNI